MSRKTITFVSGELYDVADLVRQVEQLADHVRSLSLNGRTVALSTTHLEPPVCLVAYVQTLSDGSQVCNVSITEPSQ